MSPRDRNQLGSPLSGYDCTSRRAELVVPTFDALPAYETDIVGLQLCFKGGGFGFQVMRTVSVKGVLIVAAEVRFVRYDWGFCDDPNWTQIVGRGGYWCLRKTAR